MEKGLGRGLSALISEKNHSKQRNNVEQDITENNSLVDELSVNALRSGKFQPRIFFNEDELVELSKSIKNNGIVQPILVRQLTKDVGVYEIVAGERRWRAAKLCGLENVPVIIKDFDDKKALEIAIIENVQRQDLQILEEADGYKRLIDEFNYTQEELSGVIGKSRSQISNTLRLIDLPESIKCLLNENKISAGHARAILTHEQAEELAEIIVKKGLNVRQAEKLAKKSTDIRKESAKKKEKDPEIIQLEKEISGKLGLKVMINNHNEGGEVVIAYHSLGELDIILKKLD